MRKYNTFIEYLTENYIELIKKGLSEFLLDDFKENLIKKDLSYINSEVLINNAKIVGVNFTKSDLDYVEFEIYLRSRYTYFSYDTFSRQSVVIDENKYFICNMKGKFEDGFKFGKGKIEKINKKPFVETLTNALVHVIDKDKMEEYATKFLKYYCPEALKKPMALNLTKILNEKGVKWRSAPLPMDVYGKTYFAEDYADVYDENQNIVNVKVTRGTILINTKKAEERGDGVLRNTIVHEAVHWFFHNNYFGLKHLLNNDITCAVCYRSENVIYEDEIYWMESQARSLAPKILMPKKPFIKKFKEEYKKQKDIANLICRTLVNERNAEIMSSTIASLSKFFGVSKQSVKYRLSELGYKEVDGVLNYNVDTRRYFANYQFKNNTLDDYQTFHLPNESFIDLIQNNEMIRKDVQSGKIIYTNGLLVVNNPKYIEDNKITTYGLDHVDECCVIFNVKSEGKVISENITTFTLCAGGTSKVNAYIDDEQYVKIMEQIDENILHFEKHKKDLPSTFGDTIEYHCEKSKHSYEWIAEHCNLSAATLRKFRNDEWEDIKLINIIKFGIGLRLSYPYIQDLINKSHISMTRICKANNVLLTVISTCQRLGMKRIYSILKKSGNEGYLKLSKSYIKKHNLE